MQKIKFIRFCLIICAFILSVTASVDGFQGYNEENSNFVYVSISSSGDLVAAGDPGTGILALISKNGSAVRAYRTGLNISGIAISGNGEYISCVSEEGDVLLLDDSGNLLWDESVKGLDPKTILSEDGSLCLVYNDDLPDDPYTQTLHVFDKDGKEFFSKRVPSIDSAGISSDGDYFFAGTSHFTRGRLYARSGDLQWNYKISQLSYILANPRTSISGDLNLIGIAGLGWVTGLDKSGNELFNKSLAYMVEERPAYRKPLVYVDVSGEGNRLVTGSESVVYCLNDTGSVLWSFEFENKKISDDIGSGAITNDGKIVAVSSGNYILIFDENRDVRSQYKTDLPVKRIFISDDGGVIAGGARNGILYLLSDETGLISVDVGSLPVQPLPTQGIPGDTTPTNEQTAPVFLFLPLIAFAITAVLQRRKK